MRLSVAGVALLLAVTGCQHGSPRTVPWSGTVPAQLQQTQVRAEPPCQANQLRVVGAGMLFQPAQAGGGTGTVRLTNAGHTPCNLAGRPTVRFVGAPKAPRQQQIDLDAPRPAFPAVLPPQATLQALAPGHDATLTVDWRNWCVPGATRSTKLVPPKAARITLPGAGSVEVNYSAVTSCEDPHKPSTIGVRPFQPAPIADPTAWTNLRVQATVEEPPQHGRRGDTIAYVVEIRNAATAGTLTFDRCPALAQYLAPKGSTEAYVLSCAAATPIPPGQSERFEMRIRIPTDAPTGPNGLFWALDVTSERPLEVVSRIVVDG